MKNLFITILLAIITNFLPAQDIINVYANWENTQSANPPSYNNATSTYQWSSARGTMPGTYNGEYQIYLDDFIWGPHTDGQTPLYQASYVIETVSFPFTMNCAFTAAGCTSTSTSRNLYLPDDANLDASGEWWNYTPVTNVADKLYRITPLDGLNKFNNRKYTLKTLILA